jgi:hypothetical protein
MFVEKDDLSSTRFPIFTCIDHTYLCAGWALLCLLGRLYADLHGQDEGIIGFELLHSSASEAGSVGEKLTIIFDFPSPLLVFLSVSERIRKRTELPS